MRNNTKYVLLVTVLVTVLLFTGCGKKESDIEPVVSETVEEIEATTPEEVVEPVEEETAPVEDIVAEEEIVETVVEEELTEETILTPAELDQLKANATTEWEKKNIEIYEQITAGGSWTGDNGGTYDKVVGIPGDTSWRKLTDAEAQAIVAKGEMNKETFLAECELEGASWTGFDGRTGTVYFDPYAYREAMDQVIPSENDSTFDGTETTKIEQQ